ncbi:DUF2269 family protein [Paenibacillus chartarius]|uniref:DUF2269 family protein n=1 Tax=Paenibacillus chartarius TaxID=747481 RepID=A0ABV6DVC5_9BACL
MVWLVIIHVLSAVLGLGPAFAFPWMLRAVSTVNDMSRNLQQVAYLEKFPKVFGSLAVLSGLALFWLGSYGPFMQLWLAGTLAVFIVTEVLVIGFLNPAANRLMKRIAESPLSPEAAPTGDLAGLYTRVRSLHIWSGVLGLIIFVLMIAKPH